MWKRVCCGKRYWGNYREGISSSERQVQILISSTCGREFVAHCYDSWDDVTSSVILFWEEERLSVWGECTCKREMEDLRHWDVGIEEQPAEDRQNWRCSSTSQGTRRPSRSPSVSPKETNPDDWFCTPASTMKRKTIFVVLCLLLCALKWMQSHTYETDDREIVS